MCIYLYLIAFQDDKFYCTIDYLHLSLKKNLLGRTSVISSVGHLFPGPRHQTTVGTQQAVLYACVAGPYSPTKLELLNPRGKQSECN